MIVSEPLIKTWFALQRQLIAGLQLAYVDLHGAGVPAGGLFVTYPDGLDHRGELALAAELAQRSGAPVTGKGGADGAAVLRIAYPLHLGGHAEGAVVIEVDAPLDRQVAIIELLKWGEAWLNLALQQLDGSVQSQTFGEVVRSGLAQPDYNDSVTAVLGLLPTRVPCSRVALGRPAGADVRVEAVSGVASLNARNPRIKAMAAVMRETLQAGEMLCWPDGDSAAETRPLHRQLVEEHGLTGVCSVPLADGLPEPMVLLFEFAGDAPWNSEAAQRCVEASLAVAPLLELRRERGRSWWQRFQSLTLQGLQRLFGRSGRLRRTAVFAGLVLLVVAAAGKQPYRISAPATVEGAIQQAVVAPFDGFINSADFRAGQTVSAGDLLARLDDRELKTEQRRLQADEAELKKQHRQAVATLDHGETKVVEAQLEQTRARLAMIESQLERTALRAPFDGIVISGDWSRSLGVPVTRGDLLFEIAPLNNYRVALEVNDSDVAALAAGQQGTLRLAALPRRDLRLAVSNVAAMAADEVAAPAFRVEAKLAYGLTELRPGMQGVAKVSVGERRRWWIWTHALSDWLQLQLWRWMP